MTTETSRTPTAIDALPKAELHVHLEGSVRPDTLVALAARHGVRVKLEDVIARYNYSDFAGFLEAFKWVTSFLRDPEDYAIITRHLAEELVVPRRRPAVSPRVVATDRWRARAPVRAGCAD